MDNIVLTENGLALRDKLNAGQTTATFTRFCTSSAEYDQSELGALTELKDSKLESAVTNLEIREDHTMVISGAVDNKSLQEGYYITLIGLYAKETDGEEILFAVSKASSPMYMPEKSGALSGMSIRFSVKIENSDSINVTVDPTTAATLGDLNALRSEVTTPTFEDYESEESPALPALEDAMKQIKSGNTMRVILQNTKAAFKGLLNLVNAKVNQKDYDAAVSKLNGDIASLTENMVPDMSKMAPIITSSKDVNNKAYTIAEDGYITASVRTQGTSGSPFIRINIGGTNLYEGQGMSGMYKYLWSSVIPVRKGMKITFTLTAGENITDAQYNVWFFK